MQPDPELERAARHYRAREADPTLRTYWSLGNPVALHCAQERERYVLRALNRAGLELSGLRTLDLGCGAGREFASLSRWGLPVALQFGVDLMHERLLQARRETGAAVVQASAGALPFADATFDLVLQNVVFSSLLDERLRRQCAAEMLRVLRPGGALLWYDAFRSRSRDPHFRPLPRAELLALFPGVEWRLETLTSDLGLASRLHRWFGRWAVEALDLSGLARTHLLGVGRKP